MCGKDFNFPIQQNKTIQITNCIHLYSILSLFVETSTAPGSAMTPCHWGHTALQGRAPEPFHHVNVIRKHMLHHVTIVNVNVTSPRKKNNNFWWSHPTLWFKRKQIRFLEMATPWVLASHIPCPPPLFPWPCASGAFSHFACWVLFEPLKPLGAGLGRSKPDGFLVQDESKSQSPASSFTWPCDCCVCFLMFLILWPIARAARMSLRCHE